MNVIRNQNGEGATDNEIRDMLETKLFPNFSEHGIYFTWDESINEIVNNTAYNGGIQIGRSLVAQYDDPGGIEGIDLYVWGENENWGNGGGTVGGDSYLVMGSGEKHNGTKITESSFITHEMGHVFNLHHHCVIGDEDNYMAECSGIAHTEWNRFNDSQVSTMKDAIETLDHLSDALVNDGPSFTPDASNINITVGPFCEEGWAIARVAYSGVASSELDWEWGGKSVSIHGNGELIQISGAQWKYELWAKASNTCGTSDWKKKTFFIPFNLSPPPCLPLP